MAFPNVNDIVTTTIESRSGKLKDNVTKNNAVLAQMREKGRIRTFSGGSQILEEFTFQENGNFQYYSGYDTLSVGSQDVISAASFGIKQAACAVVISGLEMLENSGKEKIIDLLEGRINAAEATVANNIAAGIYSDGTGYGGKQITGLGAAVVSNPTTGVYGGIDRSVWSFWRNQVVASGGLTGANILANMNSLWLKLLRGKDRPDLLLADNVAGALYIGALQSLQRFTESKVGNIGFPTIKFMDADLVIDGGIGGFAPASQIYFLNTDYLHYRPHKDRDMVVLNPNKRSSINQDAEAQILGWAGNMTCSGAQFQGLLT